MEKSFKRMKLILIVCCALIILAILLSIYVFFPKKATVSVYSDNLSFNLEKEGIKADDFNKYLSIISLLVNEEYEDKYGAEEIENIRMLDTAIAYIHSKGENIPDLNETGNYEYDANTINKIIQETKGLNIEKNIPVGTKYTYNEEKNVYVVSENNTITTCEIIEIEEFSKKDNKIEVTYTCYLGEKDSTYKIKSILVENSEFEYSEYFVNTIEKISQ